MTQWLEEEGFSSDPTISEELKLSSSNDPNTQGLIGWVQLFLPPEATGTNPDDSDLESLRNALLSSISAGRLAKRERLLSGVDNVFFLPHRTLDQILEEISIEIRHCIRAEGCIVFGKNLSSAKWHVVASDFESEGRVPPIELDRHSIVEAAAICGQPIRALDVRNEKDDVWRLLGKGEPTPTFHFIDELIEKGLVNIPDGFPVTLMGVPVKGEVDAPVRFFIVLIHKNKTHCKHFSPTDAAVVTHLGSWLWARCEHSLVARRSAPESETAPPTLSVVDAYYRHRFWASMLKCSCIASCIAATALAVIAPFWQAILPIGGIALLIRICSENSRDHEAQADFLLRLFNMPEEEHLRHTSTFTKWRRSDTSILDVVKNWFRPKRRRKKRPKNDTELRERK